MCRRSNTGRRLLIAVLVLIALVAGGWAIWSGYGIHLSVRYEPFAVTPSLQTWWHDYRGTQLFAEPGHGVIILIFTGSSFVPEVGYSVGREPSYVTFRWQDSERREVQARLQLRRDTLHLVFANGSTGYVSVSREDAAALLSRIRQNGFDGSILQTTEAFLQGSQRDEFVRWLGGYREPAFPAVFRQASSAPASRP